MAGNPVESTTLSLPKGGGAIKGIGETFQPNLFTGTGNHTIPLALSPGRNGVQPALTLEYSSGSGNGIFGLGWTLTLPRVSRKTEKGIPRYDDHDVFVMTGAEDLVRVATRFADPVSGEDRWIAAAPRQAGDYTVTAYRSRTEGTFARVERWQHAVTGETHWRSITHDNITSTYGRTNESRLADPDDPARVSEWLLDETFDATGCHIRYEYARDDPRLYTGADPELHLADLFEQNRRATQLYPRRIYYGNLPDPLVDAGGTAVTYADGTPVGYEREGRRYAFEVVLDYGDWHIPSEDPHPAPIPAGQQERFGLDGAAVPGSRPVPVRADRFSQFRAGFEVRTLRRCRRVLMFHHFAELSGPTLVRSTDFEYTTDTDTNLSLLARVTVSGYRRDATGTYTSARLPPVQFEYSPFTPHEQHYQALDAVGGELPPEALDDASVALVDLFGDGLPDVLHSGPAGFRYWRNLGGGQLDRPRTLPQIASTVALAQSGVTFGDMGGDGQAELLVLSGALPGFFETTGDEAWQTFKAYETVPSIDVDNANGRMVDLTGNGLSDLLVTQPESFVWFECLGERGFGPPQFVARLHDLDRFPDVFFDDRRVRMADMTGDGQADIVCVHDGGIEYWPGLGYGRFGRRITMANAPRLEAGFDPRRLFLADVNGTGCADLVYVDFDRVHCWFNQSGNQWSAPVTIHGTPIVTNPDAIRFADVFGTGTATLLWTYDAGTQLESNYKALDLCGGVKPYVITQMSNELGATTRITYAPSTRHFVADQANGTPWITRMPFPVQVVDKVELFDHVARTKLVTTFKYHHGYFDGAEREFRGFGRVDQFDAQSFADAVLTEDAGDPLAAAARVHHVPPVETRTWFHTGVYFDPDRSPGDPFDALELTDAFRREFYQGDGEATLMQPHDVDAAATPREAYRALRGAPLRVEMFAHDASARAEHPYVVTENRWRVTALQPAVDGAHAVYLRHEKESVSYQYERNPVDPRIRHTLLLDVDAFGNPRKSMVIAYGRRQPDPALPAPDRAIQARTAITYTEAVFTEAIDEADAHRTPLPSEARTYELTGYTPEDDGERFGFDEWIRNDFARLADAVDIAYYESADPAQLQKRLIEHVRTRYRADDLTDLLPLGTMGVIGLPGETYRLAFTPDMIDVVYGDRVTDAMLTDDGGYLHTEGDAQWWIASGRVFYSPDPADTPDGELAFAQQHFFRPHRSRDPFGNIGFTHYDPYVIGLERTIDAVGNRIAVGHDYRVLQPQHLVDPNGNRMEVAFDTLGRVVGTAVMGKAGDADGDSLTGFAADVSPAQLEAFLADPPAHAAALLGSATTRVVYDLERFRVTRDPVSATIITRETHVSEPSPPDGPRLQIQIAYSDGFGRQVQQKSRAPRGPLVPGGPPVDSRWIGSGWRIFNNKGKPVREFEPFFDDTPAFRFAVQAGATSTIFYDPVERVIATLHPNHTWDKVVCGTWREERWDVSDTVLVTEPREDPDVGALFAALPDVDYLPTWHGARRDGQLGPSEQAAAERSALHAATPTVSHADTLGRAFLVIAHNRFLRDDAIVEEHYSTRLAFDIEGNQRGVFDARGRTVVRYDYDLLGTPVRRASMDAGERRTLVDITGKPIFRWDSRGHRVRMTHDGLRRPLGVFLQAGATAEQQVGRTVYGESLPAPETQNLRGRVVHAFDQSGVLTSDQYDYKGNPLVHRRRFAKTFDATIDWLANPELAPDTFVVRTEFDALNRPVAIISPDGSVYRPSFSEAGLLERADVHLRGAATATPFVAAVEYDAKGQRTRIVHGNQVMTEREYEPETLRLVRSVATREFDTERVQDIGYTYDASGLVTQVRDDSQQTVYFANQVVPPTVDYVYDAVSRLVAAEGREHAGQASQPETTFDDRFRVGLPQPGDGQAMRRYSERYEYDATANLQTVTHRAAQGSWTRAYSYEEPSLLDSAAISNRLTRTQVGDGTPDTYTFDAHGNMTAMPHLATIEWDFKDQLRAVDLGGGGVAHYVYDAAGQRVRKVIVKNDGARTEERLYIGNFEVFRQRDGAGAVVLERETLHVMDGTLRVAIVETTTVDAATPVPRPPLLRYQYGNHLGSAALELDGSGRVISYEEYYPYGSTSYQAVAGDVDVSVKRYRHTGMERDEETGLAYHTSRYYAPWLGRWSSADPAGLKEGVNVYLYCRGNPVNRIDPRGSDSEWCWNPFASDCSVRWQLIGGAIEMGIGCPLAETGIGAAVCISGMDDVTADMSGNQSLKEQAISGGLQDIGGMDKAKADYYAVYGSAIISMALSAGLPVPHPVPAPAQLARAEAATGGAITATDAKIVAGAENVAEAAKVAAPVEATAGATVDAWAGTAKAGATSAAASAATETATALAGSTSVAARVGAQIATATKTLDTMLEIVTRMERHVARQNARVASAIRNGNAKFFEKLGMSDKQIRILMQPGHKVFGAMYGNAIERAVARAFRSDTQLGRLVIDARNAAGEIFPGVRPGGGRALRPDFGLKDTFVLIDLTTPGQAASKAAKYHDKVIVLTYERPTF